MKIFILDLNSFPKTVIYEFSKKVQLLEEYGCPKKKYQHYAGRYLLDYVLKNFYEINEYKIVYDGKKPLLKNSDIYFSISHSENIVGLAIDCAPVGFDIEYNKRNRKFREILSRYSVEIPPLSEADLKNFFYEFWTRLEAKIKLASQREQVFFSSDIYEREYTYSIASEKNIENIEKVFVSDN